MPSWADKGSNGTVGARRSGGVCTNTSTSYIYRPQYRPIRFPFATSDQQPLECFKKGNDKKPSKAQIEEKLRRESLKSSSQTATPQPPKKDPKKDKKDEKKQKQDIDQEDEETPNGKFNGVGYHNKFSTGRKSPAPKNGQAALNNSFPYSNKSPHRIGISEDEFVVLSQTRPLDFHGHVRLWEELTPAMRNTLIKYGLATEAGKIIKKTAQKIINKILQ